MKKLLFLLIMLMTLGFSSCGSSEIQNAKEEITDCQEDCQKACCLGCKATKGLKFCIILEDGSMPCCLPDEM